MQTLPKRKDHRKHRVEVAHSRDAFRRLRASIVGSYFNNHQVAFLDQRQFNVQRSGSHWRIRPDWRLRLDWDNFRREQLSHLSDKQVQLALSDLEALEVICLTHEGFQIVASRIEKARECVA